MFKFFRHIRRKLLSESRFNRYLIYAIGEIALVMIGILLAFQVNSWNQNRIDNLAKDEAVKDLHQEFLAIKEDFESHLQFLNQTHDEWDSYLSHITQPNVFDQNELEYRPRTASRKFAPKNSTLKSILSTGKIDKIENKELRNELTGWESILSTYEFIQEWHEVFFRNELGPVERETQNTLIRTPGAKKYQFPGFDKTDRIKKSLGDTHYQNLLLTQFDILKLKIAESAPVTKRIDQIITLLEKEMDIE